MAITFDKITGFYVDTPKFSGSRPAHNGRFDSFDRAYQAARDGDHIHFICGRQSREPTRCMCKKIPVCNTLQSTQWMRCEYCGAL